ncbi:TonB-dependent receptor [Gilvibacter sp.]|uniref:TonB-dependent receptor n=1 Tax=Gilvibacter sp. TaxID=2729997 RepID=UPI003F49DFD2
MRLSKSGYFFLISLLLLITSTTSFAQEQIKLSAYLKQLETQNDIRFSYAPEAIEDISITPTTTPDLQANIEYIKARTGLQITKINERYYSVSAPNSIHIVVLDATTGAPLPNANVMITDQGAGYTTNAEGSAYIPNPTNTIFVEIQYLGYQTEGLNLGPVEYNTVVVSLKPSVDQLEEVLLQPVFTQGIYRTNDGSYRFNTDKFGLLPGIAETDVLQISQTLPGVESVDETVSNINIRGGSNGENLLLWDGMRVYQSGHFYGLISAINPYITEDVFIYRNGTHSRYGESVSGVIDLKAMDEVTEQIHGKATLNLLHANAFLDIPISEKLSVMVAGRRSLNDLYQTPIYNSYSERVFQDTQITNLATPNEQSDLNTSEDFNFFDVSAKVLYNPSQKDRLRFNFLAINNNLNFNQNLSNDAFELSETSELNQENIAAGLHWQRTWNSKWSSTVGAYRSQYNLDAANFELLTTEFDTQGNEVISFVGRAQLLYRHKKNVQWEAGYEFIETGVTNSDQTTTPEFRRRVKEVLVGHHLYNQLDWNPFNGKTQINAGVRLTHYPKINEYRFEPRLNLHQKLGAGFALEFHGELKSQSISQAVAFQNEFLGVENRRWIQANGNEIPLITSEQWSTGLVWNKRNWLINLEYFEKSVEGISATTQGFQNQFANSAALGSYQVFGLELIVNKRWRGLGAWLGYTYSNNDYQFDSFDPQSFANNLDITHSFRAAISYDLGRLSTVFGLQWRSGKPFTLPLGEAPSAIQDTEDIPFSAPNAERLTSYFRADLSFKYIVLNKSGYTLKANAAFQNIFNNNNLLDRYFVSQQIGEDQFAINQIENRSLRFTPNFALELSF